MSAAPNRRSLETLEARQVAQQLEDLEDRLVARYAERPEITEDRVTHTIKIVRDRFADARIHAFLPILVERAVRRELEQ